MKRLKKGYSIFLRSPEISGEVKIYREPFLGESSLKFGKREFM